MNRLFYRVGKEGEEGLWYNKQGEFTGLIHKEFSWCNASQLQMPFEQELVGYLSVADSLEHLYKWFNRAELLILQQKGFNIYEYSTDCYKFYDLYKHNVIHQYENFITNRIKLI